jgi:hypothetical protein
LPPNALHNAPSSASTAAIATVVRVLPTAKISQKPDTNVPAMLPTVPHP